MDKSTVPSKLINAKGKRDAHPVKKGLEAKCPKAKIFRTIKKGKPLRLDRLPNRNDTPC